MTGFWAEIIDEEVARRMSDIIGPNSAFGKALEAARMRRNQGEDVVLVKGLGGVLVVPRSDLTNITQFPKDTMP